MKKTFIVYTLILWLSGYLPLHAQDSISVRPLVFKTNFLGPFSALVERQLKNRMSLQLSLQRVDVELFGLTKFFSFTPEVKFYLSRRPLSERRPAPSGFYLSPYLKYRNVREVRESGFLGGGSRRSVVAYNMLGMGSILGAQVIFRKGFTLDVFVGGGYFSAIGGRQIYGSDSNNPLYQEEIRPQDYRADIRLGLCIGYAFKVSPPG